jgi:hypothetical protein
MAAVVPELAKEEEVGWGKNITELADDYTGRF